MYTCTIIILFFEVDCIKMYTSAKVFFICFTYVYFFLSFVYRFIIF